MKGFVIGTLTAVACFLGTTANAQVCTTVSVGGADVDFPPGEGAPPNNDASLSILALEKCDGTVKGQFHDVLAGIGAVHARVTCLAVVGNEAWIGGVITHVTPASVFGDDFTGVPMFIRVRDNGSTANDPPDQASFFFFGETELDCLDQPEVDLLDLNNGQVQIMER